jgi:hypothetical protein
VRDSFAHAAHANGALGSFDGSRHVTQCLQWAGRSIVGCVLGGVTL